jgi:hypothetical protein
MRTSLAVAAFLALGALSTQAAFAGDSTFELGPQASTLGIGGEASVAVAKMVDVRADFGSLNVNVSGVASDVNYAAGAHLSSFSGLVDLHPFSNGFRVSGGLVSGQSSFGFNAVPNTNVAYTINGNTYSTADIGTVYGSAAFGGTNPYAGLGFGGGRGHKGVGITFDAGVVFNGTPTVTLATTKDDLPPSVQPQFQSDLATARSALQSDFSYLKLFPVVRFGLQARV